MKTSVIIGLLILAIVWLCLAWQLLSSVGVNLKNLLLLAISATIIFVPLYRKYFKGAKDDK